MILFSISLAVFSIPSSLNLSNENEELKELQIVFTQKLHRIEKTTLKKSKKISILGA